MAIFILLHWNILAGILSLNKAMGLKPNVKIPHIYFQVIWQILLLLYQDCLVSEHFT